MGDRLLPTSVYDSSTLFLGWLIANVVTALSNNKFGPFFLKYICIRPIMSIGSLF